jgi:polyphosphate kinase
VDESICKNVKEVFNLITYSSKSDKVNFDKNLLVSKFNMRQQLEKLIMEQAELGPDGFINIKCNSLNDERFILLLEGAASKGCIIKLIVRGMCTWVPEKYLNKNVTITSVVWDKLEHSRVYCFGIINPTIYIGSADLVTSKLDNRIETLVRIKSADILGEMCNYLKRYIINENAWTMTVTDGVVDYVKG